MADVTRSIEYVINATDKASSTFRKVGISAGLMGGAVVGALGLMVKGAADAQVAAAKVNSMLATMGEKGAEAKAGILEAAKAAVKLGFDDEAAAESITRLFQRTGDLNKAMRLNQIAMDLSRNKNLDLVSASNMVGMVLSGNAKVLKQYQIDLKDTATPMEALDELQKKLATSAATFADTAQGKLLALKESWSNVSDAIGDKLLPVLTQLLDKMLPVLERINVWIEKNPELTEKIVLFTGAVGGLLLGLGALWPIMQGIIAAFTILKAIVIAVGFVIGALSIPVVAIGTAIVGLGLLVYELVTHWEGLKWMVGQAVDWMIKKIGEWLEYFRGVLESAKTFLLDLIMGPIDTIRAAYDSFFSWLADKFSWLMGKTNEATSSTSTTGKGGSGLSKSGPNYSAPARRAGGGLISEPFTLVGENGPEIISAPSGARVHTNEQSRRMMGGLTLNVTVQGSVVGLSARQLVESLGREIMKQISPLTNAA